jgi:hypothetical protein
LDDFVGIKKIQLASDVTIEDFQREVNLLRRAQSDFVVRIFDFGFDNKSNAGFLYTEMCSCSLEDILQQH